MVKRTNIQIKEDIFSFMKANGIMTLATGSKDGPWVCTLYYGMDKDMNLYVVTDPKTIHGKDIAKSKKVAFNIFDSHQRITKPKRGVQGKGTCEIVKGIARLTKALYLWHKANPGIEEKITIKEVIRKLSDTKIYQITPTYLKYFNKKLYARGEYGIWEV